MTTIAQDEPRRVTGGVDTHKDVHVAAVLDTLGRRQRSPRALNRWEREILALRTAVGRRSFPLHCANLRGWLF